MSVIREFLDELPRLGEVWRSFIVALLFVAGVIWAAVNWAYSVRVDRLTDQLLNKGDEVSELTRKLTDAQVSSDFKIDLSPVKDCRYTNETVEVDGKYFVDCIFTNVTFRYVGTGQTAWQNSKFIGNIAVETKFIPAKVYHKLVKDLENMSGRGPFKFGEREAGGPITPNRPPTRDPPDS